MTFEDFHKALISDEKWYETMQMVHKYKPFKDTCLLVYGTAVGAGTLSDDIKEHRNHVHNKLAKTPVKIQNLIQTHQTKNPPEKLDVKVYATDEQREYWLNKLKEEIKEIKVKPVIKMSHKEIAEEGDWIPKKKHVPTDPLYLHEHEKKLHDCRVKVIKDRHPDFTDEQIEEYITKNF